VAGGGGARRASDLVPVAVTVGTVTVMRMEPADTFPTRAVIAVDGAAAGNPGPGGWSWYVNDRCWAAGGEAPTTNNRMELIAVIEALRSARDEPGIVFICDSRYVIDAATKWMHSWKRRGWHKADGNEVANKDLFVDLDALLGDARRRGQGVEFTWIRGHSGHPLNEAADSRARKAAEAMRDRRAVSSGPGWVN
jgi:ribonuclease HI